MSNRAFDSERLQLVWPEATTTVDNLASRRVIEANGGTLVERFRTTEAHGGAESLRYRIVLSG